MYNSFVSYRIYTTLLSSRVPGSYFFALKIHNRRRRSGEEKPIHEQIINSRGEIYR